MASAQEDLQRYIYRVDAADRIVWVCPQWLEFGEENDMPSDKLSGVVGSDLWSHITGLGIRQLYEELFAGIRLCQSEIAIPFNCDSPTLLRNMTLTIRSLTGGAIELEGRLNSTRVRPYAPILDKNAERSEESVPICSICRKMLVSAEWVTVGEAVVRRRLFTKVPVPHLEETLCPSCKNVSAS